MYRKEIEEVVPSEQGWNPANVNEEETDLTRRGWTLEEFLMDESLRKGLVEDTIFRER